MIPIYEYFGSKGSNILDWSEDALYSIYYFESIGRGSGDLKPDNGYAYGKKLMDISISMWKEDLYVTLWPWELYEDPNLPDWWLDKLFKKMS